MYRLSSSPCLFAAWPAALPSQSCCPDFRLELLQTQLMGIEFKQRQLESQAWRERERRNVPVYNARLNGAVLAFHKHIIKDGHYLITNCSAVPKTSESNQILLKKTGSGDEVSASPSSIIIVSLTRGAVNDWVGPQTCFLGRGAPRPC